MDDPVKLDGWLRRLAAELGLDDVDLDHAAIRTLLDLARDAAHQVDRPAAPLTTFLVGVAVGRGAGLEPTAASASTLALAVGAEAEAARSSGD